LLTDLIF